MRIIRRQDGGTPLNAWTIQGSNYNNYVDNTGTIPTVVIGTTSSSGGLISQGSRFTIGLPGGVPVTPDVTGKVTYNNSVSTPLAGVTVTLGTATTTTDAAGNYTFSSVAPGTYTITASTTKPWGGVNATDALFVLLHANPGHGVILTGINLLAADVDGNGNVTATDALLIRRRAVGLDNSFARGNWVFSPKSVTVAATTLTGQDLKALTVGDVDSSYVPTVAKAGSRISFSSEGKIQVSPAGMIEVPVQIASNVNVAALSLSFTYPADLVEFQGASSKAQDLTTFSADGKINIAWASIKAMDLKSGDAIVTLRFKATEQFKAGSKFDVQVDNMKSEIADANGQIINATLKTATVEGFVPSEFSLKQNYPNPFNPATTIRYELPVTGTVSLVIFNSLGEQVATLVNGVQDAGIYKFEWNASSLSSGIYFYRIDVKAGDQSFSKVNKMILMK